MLNSIIRKPALVLTVPLFALIAASYPAHAEIYKWRDNRGVIQYSDRPPVESFTKVTRNEMVNALQTKDLCTTGPIVKNNTLKVASNQNAGAFFSKLLRTSTSGTAPTTTTSLFKTSSSTGKLSTTSTTSTTSTATTTSTTTNNTSFLSGGKNVTVLGFSKKPIKTVSTVTSPTTTTTTTAAPTTTTTTAPTTSTTTTAPTTTTSTVTEPIQLATASAAPTTTTSTSANLIQVGLMPAVDISKNMKPAIGASVIKVAPTAEIAPDSSGDFRIVCATSHMSNDDPIVYPNQQGAAHHHTFFGNVTTDYKSNLMAFSTTGNSTCNGGIMNRSAYWVPSMIDTSSNAAIAPTFAIFYYKTDVDGSLVTPPPKGLRMITGNSKATDSTTSEASFTCIPPDGVSRPFYGWSKHIPPCIVGDTMQMAVPFPQCWDAKNLDSPNHKDHMAKPTNGACPATHPVAIPKVTVVLNFKINAEHQTSKWRLASDNYNYNGQNAGYSAHADWVNGWDETFMAGVVKNCLNAKKDAHAHLLCDGRMFY